MLFQLVVHYLLLSDLELDSTAHKIFVLIFDAEAFGEYLKAKHKWNSGLSDFANFSLNHLTRAISLFPENQFKISDILEIKMPICILGNRYKKPSFMLKKRDAFDGKNIYKNSDDKIWRISESVLVAFILKII